MGLSRLLRASLQPRLKRTSRLPARLQAELPSTMHRRRPPLEAAQIRAPASKLRRVLLHGGKKKMRVVDLVPIDYVQMPAAAAVAAATGSIKVCCGQASDRSTDCAVSTK